MRHKQKQTCRVFQERCELSDRQMVALTMTLASIHGPLVISSLIELGLENFRKVKKAKAKKKGPR